MFCSVSSDHFMYIFVGNFLWKKVQIGNDQEKVQSASKIRGGKTHQVFL